MNGAGHYIDKFWGSDSQCHYLKSVNHNTKYFSANDLCNAFGGGFKLDDHRLLWGDFVKSLIRMVLHC